MLVKPTLLDGCFVLEPKVYFDSRGYFMETFNQSVFNELTGNQIKFVQDNFSRSSKGVLRGLHYQTGAYVQAKLVRVVEGSVLDIAVDIRPDSKTYGQHHAEILSGENHKQVFLPKGFAHGFLVLSDSALFEYKCDQYYNLNSEAGIIYNDSSLKIDWQFIEKGIIVSEKDLQWPEFAQSKSIW